MKIIVLILAALLLSGCQGKETFEYVTDELAVPASVQPREVHFFLAEDPAMPAMESDGGKLYLCGDYDVMIQTREGGNLEETVKAISGFSSEDLTLIQTASGDVDRYEFVWTSCAEDGELIGRATILDDGNYHYVLSATVGAEKIEEYQEIWNGIFESFTLV